MKDIKIHPITGKILRRDVRPMEYTYKEQFIRFMVDNGVLKFGEFTLKRLIACVDIKHALRNPLA